MLLRWRDYKCCCCCALECKSEYIVLISVVNEVVVAKYLQPNRLLIKVLSKLLSRKFRDATVDRRWYRGSACRVNKMGNAIYICFASHANGILVQSRSRVCIASSICWKILIGYRSNKSYGWWHSCVWHIFQLNMRIRLNDLLTEMDAEIYILYSRTLLFYSNMLRNANDANIEFSRRSQKATEKWRVNPRRRQITCIHTRFSSRYAAFLISQIETWLIRNAHMQIGNK